MSWTVARAKSRIEHLPDSQLERLYRRMWDWIEKRYGTGAWDYPTLYATWPCLATHVLAINQIMKERKEKNEDKDH